LSHITKTLLFFLGPTTSGSKPTPNMGPKSGILKSMLELRRNTYEQASLAYEAMFTILLEDRAKYDKAYKKSEETMRRQIAVAVEEHNHRMKLKKGKFTWSLINNLHAQLLNMVEQLDVQFESIVGEVHDLGDQLIQVHDFD